MDTETYPQADVVKLVTEKFVPVKIDVAGNDPAAEKFGVGAIPDTVVALADGTVIRRFLGFRPPAAFIEELKAALAVKEQVEAARKKLAAAPDDLEARLELGVALRNGALWDAARKELAGAAERAKDGRPDVEARALFHLGVANLRAGDRAAADKAFGRLAALEHDAARALADDVALEHGLARLEEGAAALERGKRKAPEILKDARGRLEGFLKDHPASDRAAEGRYHLAFAQALAGDEAPGKATLQALVEKFPESPWAAKAKDMLKDGK